MDRIRTASGLTTAVSVTAAACCCAWSAAAGHPPAAAHWAIIATVVAVGALVVLTTAHCAVQVLRRLDAVEAELQDHRVARRVDSTERRLSSVP
ncbi:MAG TPA: hypothetical protein VGD67_21795 [Pseudonocardiaceae bacterium]